MQGIRASQNDQSTRGGVEGSMSVGRVPRAKVVHLQNAAGQHLAKMRPVRLVHIRAALATNTSRAIMLDLQGLQLREECA